MTVTARPVTLTFRDGSTQVVTCTVDERSMGIVVSVPAVNVAVPAGSYRWSQTITQTGAGPEANSRTQSGTFTGPGTIAIPAFDFRGNRPISAGHQIAVNVDVDDGNQIPFATSRLTAPWTFNQAGPPHSGCRIGVNWNAAPYVASTGFDIVPQSVWQPQLDAIKAAGFDILRTQLLFPFWLQPSAAHTWDPVAAGKIDAFHDYAHSIGLDIYQGCGAGLVPAWGGDPTYGSSSYTFGTTTYNNIYLLMTASALDGWIADVAARWPHFTMFQSGNEPNTGSQLANWPAIAARVVTEVHRSRSALNNHIPGHTYGALTMAGMAPYFADLCYAAGLVAADYDWIDGHPYGLNVSPIGQVHHGPVTPQGVDYSGAPVTTAGLNNNSKIVHSTEAVIDVAANHGQPAPKFALSELGYSASSDLATNGPAMVMGESTQAAWVPYDLDQATRHPNIAAVFIYGWWDPWFLTRTPLPPLRRTYSDWTDCYGLLRADGTAKAAKAAVVAKIAALRAAMV